MFLVFWMMESLILSALKQKILGEIKQLNGIKNPKNILSSKMINTFYLKHQKYPFCAPIFHPLSDTESKAFILRDNKLSSTGSEYVPKKQDDRMNNIVYIFLSLHN